MVFCLKTPPSHGSNHSFSSSSLNLSSPGNKTARGRKEPRKGRGEGFAGDDMVSLWIKMELAGVKRCIRRVFVYNGFGLKSEKQIEEAHEETVSTVDS